MIYIFLLFLIIIIFLSNKILSKQYQQIIVWCLYVILWFLAAFRYETGGDWQIYYSIYQDVPIKWENFLIYISTSRIEKGFLYIIYFIKKINLNKQYLFIFSTTLSFLLMLKALKNIFKNNVDSWKIFLILYFGQLYFYKDFIIMRQSIASSFALLGMAYFLQKKTKKFILCLFLGFFFHKTIIITIPIILLSKIKLKRKVILTFMLLIFSIYILKIPYLKEIATIIHPQFPRRYFQNAILAKNELFFIFWFFVLLLITLYRKNKFNIYTEKNIFLKNIFFISLIIPFLIYESKEVMSRIGVYLNLFKFLSISLIIPLIYKKEKGLSLILHKIGIKFFIIFFTSYSLITKIIFAEAYNPYQNYLFKEYNYNDYRQALKRLENAQKKYIKSLKINK